MNVHLTKKELLQLLQEAISAWKKYPASTRELLDTEAWYLKGMEAEIPFGLKDDNISLNPLAGL